MPRGRKATPAPEAEQPEPGTAGAESDPVSAVIESGRVIKHARRIQRWRVDALIPNMHNAALFPDSLSEAQIALLANDLKKHGQNVPITITPSAKIVDGERRYRAAKSLGWEHVEVIVGEELTDEEILNRVIDSCVSARQMTAREQTNIYVAIVARLREDAGRPRGRPIEQRSPNGDLCLSIQAIKLAAAAKARFPSAKLAERAEVVFGRATKDIQDQVCKGDLSISAAYALVPKRPRKTTAAEGGGAPLKVLETGSVGTPEGEGDRNKGTTGTSTGAIVPMPPLAPAGKTAKPSDDQPEADEAKSPPRLGKGSSAAAAQRGTKATRSRSIAPQPTPVPAAPESSLDWPPESNVVENPFAALRDLVPTPARVLDARRGEGPRSGELEDKDEARSVPEPGEVIERALKEIEAHGDNLLHGNSDESGQALDDLVARLQAMLARWASTGGTSAEGSHMDVVENDDPPNDDTEQSEDLESEFEPNQDDASEDDDDSETEATDSDDMEEPVENDGDWGDPPPRSAIDVEVDHILGMKRR